MNVTKQRWLEIHAAHAPWILIERLGDSYQKGRPAPRKMRPIGVKRWAGRKRRAGAAT